MIKCRHNLPTCAIRDICEHVGICPADYNNDNPTITANPQNIGAVFFNATGLNTFDMPPKRKASPIRTALIIFGLIAIGVIAAFAYQGIKHAHSTIRNNSIDCGDRCANPDGRVRFFT